LSGLYEIELLDSAYQLNDCQSIITGIIAAMYIVAIGWLYVTFLMAFTETSIVAGIVTFLFYGLLPVGLLMYLGGAKARRRKRDASESRENPPS
jgi:hypothetical protein